MWVGAAMEHVDTKMLHDPLMPARLPCATCRFLAVADNTGKRFVDETVEMSLLNNYLRDGKHPGWYPRSSTRTT